MHPVPAIVDDLDVGSCETRADGINHLLGDKPVGPAADDQHGTCERTRGGRVPQPVVPHVHVVGGYLDSDRGADVGEQVELFLAEMWRQLGPQGALRATVATEGAERLDHLGGQPCAASGTGVSSTSPRTRLVC